MRLGVLIPCRNEAPVIGRRLENLARARWPEGGPHTVVVADDHSNDGSAEIARTRAQQLFGGRGDVSCRVVSNDGCRGKPGAVRRALRELEGSAAPDLFVLSDADVLVHPEALVRLAAAFERSPDLALACGAQRFCRALDPAGRFAAPGGGPLVPAGGAYDRLTAWVRGLESRSGRLFSVHGQLLAWRASLGLQPSRGLAADDLDLRFSVRARTQPPRRVERVDGALFAECKEEGPAGREQALRRARAYFQTVCDAPPRRLPDRIDRLQLAFYRIVPPLAPVLAAVLLGLLLGLAAALWGRAGLALASLLLGALASTPPGRRLIGLLAVIARARRLERRAELGDRWEMARR